MSNVSVARMAKRWAGWDRSLSFFREACVELHCRVAVGRGLYLRPMTDTRNALDRYASYMGLAFSIAARLVSSTAARAGQACAATDIAESRCQGCRRRRADELQHRSQ